MIPWFGVRAIVEVPCTVALEQTSEFLRADVDLEGCEVGPGDEVLVHDAPMQVGFGEKVSCRRRATVVRAGMLENLRARLAGYLALTELYEVSFSDGRTP